MTSIRKSQSRRRSLILKASLFVAVYLAISLSLASFPVDSLIDRLGSNNAYLLMFFLGVLGGFTTFTGVPYHLILMSLAAGGLNPIALGACTAIGVMLGDSTMFLIGSRLKDTLSPRMRATVEHLSSYLSRHPRLISPTLVAYGMVSPFSNDFIVASLSMMGYTYWRTIIPLTFGNIFYNIALAYLGVYAYEMIIDWF
ncbi:VTT domain-containing protein [Planktotalea sp.]|uniref:VTT domain-containing protein n=1 Tax=Planktotalea sp. TaxID=2029877 RepID=UPI003D6B2C5B